MCDLLEFNSSAFQSSLHSSHGWRIKARSVRRVCQTPTPNSSTDLLKSVAGTLTDRSVCCCAGHLREVCLSATQWLWLVEFLRAAAWISLDQGSRIKAAIEMDRGFPVEPTWVTASDFPFPTSSLFPIMSLFHKPDGNYLTSLTVRIFRNEVGKRMRAV